MRGGLDERCDLGRAPVRVGRAPVRTLMHTPMRDLC